MAIKQIHVSKDRTTNEWYGKQAGAERRSFTGMNTQQEAIKQATNIARNQKLEVVIHRADNGKIRERNSYGNDPFPPRG